MATKKKPVEERLTPALFAGLDDTAAQVIHLVDVWQVTDRAGDQLTVRFDRDGYPIEVALIIAGRSADVDETGMLAWLRRAAAGS